MPVPRSLAEPKATRLDLTDPLLSVDQLAAYLGRPKKWVYNNSFRLPVLRVGRELRFRASEINAWLESDCREA